MFHPNIDPVTICVGDHWTPAESLATLIQRIGEMLSYQSYNVKSPRNGEAARWVQENPGAVPTDPAPARGEAAGPAERQVPVAANRHRA